MTLNPHLHRKTDFCAEWDAGYAVKNKGVTDMF